MASDNAQARVLLGHIQHLQDRIDEATDATDDRAARARYHTAQQLLAALFHILQEPLRPFPTGVDYMQQKLEHALSPYGLTIRSTARRR